MKTAREAAKSMAMMLPSIKKMETNLDESNYPSGWDKARLPFADKHPQLQQDMETLHSQYLQDSYTLILENKRDKYNKLKESLEPKSQLATAFTKKLMEVKNHLIDQHPERKEQYDTEFTAGVRVYLAHVKTDIALGIELAKDFMKKKEESRAKAVSTSQVTATRIHDDNPVIASKTDCTYLSEGSPQPEEWRLPRQESSQPQAIQEDHCSQTQGASNWKEEPRKPGRKIQTENLMSKEIPSRTQTSLNPIPSLKIRHTALMNKKKRQTKLKQKQLELKGSIHNISKEDIPSEELKTLLVGTNFIPVPKAMDSVIETACNHFLRTTYLKYKHRSEESTMPQWWIPSGITVAGSGNSELDTLLQNFETKLYTMPQGEIPRNFNGNDMRNLQSILQRKDILVITADKNLGYVIVDQSWYIENSLVHLQSKAFKECTEEFNKLDQGASTIGAIYQDIVNLVDKHFKELGEHEIKWILQSKKWTPMPFYILAKVHKQPVKGRPVIPTQNWVTYNLSKWIAYELNEYVDKSPHILRDSMDLINTLEHDQTLKEKLAGAKDIWLISADVEALYPNINTARGVACISKMLNREGHATSGRRVFICRALNLVLRQNYVTFLGTIYKQMNGTAIGTCLGPQYANLVMQELERDVITKWTPKGLALYRRFIDDILMIFRGKEAQAKALIQDLNSMDESIRLTTTMSNSGVDFLDLTVSVDHRFILKGCLSTKIYQKPVNQYLYLPYNSYHTQKQKTGFIKGECIRYARTCSSKEDYEALVKLFKARLMRRGYPENVINNRIKEVDYTKRHTYLQVKSKDKSLVPFLFKVEHNPRICPSFLRKQLDALAKDLQLIKPLPKALDGHITICYKLPRRMHALVLKARKDKGL
jgi:hypothetical protein